MKRLMKLVALTLSLLVLPLFALAQDAAGSAAVSDGQTYTVEQMLTYALQDEYMAQAEYEALMQAFGANNPYANIIQAELTHEQLLLPLFETYGVAVPENTAAQNVAIPATLQEAYEIGVQAELSNIAMYQAFLAQGDVPEDVRLVFEELIAGSQSHLDAFTRNAEKTGLGLGNGNWQTADQTSTYGNRMAAMNALSAQTYGNRMAAQTTTYGRNSVPGYRMMDADNCLLLNNDAPVQQSFGGGRWN
jgi:hypothetical protein